MSNDRLNDRTEEILKQDEHLVHSFADLHSLQEQNARTVISQASGAYVYSENGEQFLDGMAGLWCCLLYTSPSPRDLSTSRMPSSA